MDATVMWGFILIGAGALVAGIVGITLPPGERLGAFLTLVVGAGVGVAALAVGTRNVSSRSAGETTFLVASALGSSPLWRARGSCGRVRVARRFRRIRLPNPAQVSARAWATATRTRR